MYCGLCGLGKNSHPLNPEKQLVRPGVLNKKTKKLKINIPKKVLITSWKVKALCNHCFNLECFKNGGIKVTQKCQFCKNPKKFTHLYFKGNKLSITIGDFTYKNGEAYQKIPLV